MGEYTTDEGIVKLRWKTVIPVVIGLLIATNTVTGLIFNQEKNTEDIDYNYKRGNRKDEAMMIEVKQLIQIARLEEQIESLKDHNELRQGIIDLNNRVTLLEVEGSDSKP